MRLHEIIRVLTEEPLLITPAAHTSLLKIFENHLTLSREEFAAQREGVDWCGDAVELPQMEVINGIAHIPIGGPIGAGLGKFEKGAGAVDVADITADLDEAEESSDVRGIILDIDSPGGMVNGTPELGDRIARVEKPIYAYTSGMMASAAYWIAAASDGVFATKSADVGSIGVYTPIFDTSEQAKARGVKVEVFRSGKYKGAGMPGTSLTDEQRDYLQDRVNRLAAMFYEHVSLNRPDVTQEDMQGQTFVGQEAMDHGFIDNVVNSKSDVIALLS